MRSLAITGGPASIDGSVGRPWPEFDEAEQDALISVLHSRRWGRMSFPSLPAPESFVARFETAFAQSHDCAYGVASASGTGGLEVCLRVLGLSAGAEVVMPAVSFPGCAAAAMSAGLVPVFVDIDPSTYALDPVAVSAALTPRTEAVLAVDFGGMPCDYDALRMICDQHGLALVGDGSHAHGSTWRGRSGAAYADIAVFSCMSSKLLAIGEGAVLVTDDEALAHAAFACQHAGYDPRQPRTDFGWPAMSLRLGEWEAAVGLVGLTRLESQAQTRWRNVLLLGKLLGDIDGISPLHLDGRVTRVNPYRWHVRYEPAAFGGVGRDDFLAALRAEGVPCGPGATKPLYQYGICTVSGPDGPPRWRATDCPQAERIHQTESVDFAHQLLLGDEAEIEAIAAAVGKLRAHVDELRTWADAHGRPGA